MQHAHSTPEIDVHSTKRPMHSPARFNGIQQHVYNREEDCHMLERARVAKEAGCTELAQFETTSLEAQNKWDVVREMTYELD